MRFRFSEVCPIAILLPEIFILIVARDQNLLLRCQNDLSRYHQPDYIVFSLLPLIAGRQSAVDRQSCRRDGLDFLGCEEQYAFSDFRRSYKSRSLALRVLSQQIPIVACPTSIGVSTSAGATAFTRIPRGASSNPRDLVINVTPPLDAL